MTAPTGSGVPGDRRPDGSRDDELEVEPVGFGDPRVLELVEEVQRHYVRIYGSRDDSPFDATEFDPPQGTFLLGTVAGRPVAMGGWRLRPDLDEVLGGRGAELKRMYVADDARRRGYARRVLAALEQTAREAGAEQLVLETGTMQPEAIALYESSGYTPTVRYGHYADNELARYYAKRL